MSKKLNRREKIDIIKSYIEAHGIFIMGKLQKQFTDEDLVKYEDPSLGFSEEDKDRKIPFCELLRKVLLFEATDNEINAFLEYIKVNDKTVNDGSISSTNIIAELAANDKYGAPNSKSVFENYDEYINSMFTANGDRIISVEELEQKAESQKLR